MGLHIWPRAADGDKHQPKRLPQVVGTSLSKTIWVAAPPIPVCPTSRSRHERGGGGVAAPVTPSTSSRWRKKHRIEGGAGSPPPLGGWHHRRRHQRRDEAAQPSPGPSSPQQLRLSTLIECCLHSAEVS